MELHNFIEENLPHKYIDQVLKKLKSKNIVFTKAYISSVKRGEKNNYDVMEALILVAKSNKKTKDKLNKMII